MTARITATALKELLLEGGELALLDVREQGAHSKGHPFFACSLPLSHLELRVEDRVGGQGRLVGRHLGFRAPQL